MGELCSLGSARRHSPKIILPCLMDFIDVFQPLWCFAFPFCRPPPASSPGSRADWYHHCFNDAWDELLLSARASRVASLPDNVRLPADDIACRWWCHRYRRPASDILMMFVAAHGSMSVFFTQLWNPCGAWWDSTISTLARSVEAHGYLRRDAYDADNALSRQLLWCCYARILRQFDTFASEMARQVGLRGGRDEQAQREAESGSGDGCATL